MRSLAVRSFLCVPMMVLLLAASSCANQSQNPLSVAQSHEEEIYVILDSYRGLLKTQVLPVMKDYTVPESIRAKLGDVNRRGTPVAKAAAKALGEFIEAKAEVAAGLSPPEKINIASQNLDGHVKELQDIMSDLKAELPKKETNP